MITIKKKNELTVSASGASFRLTHIHFRSSVVVFRSFVSYQLDVSIIISFCGYETFVCLYVTQQAEEERNERAAYTIHNEFVFSMEQ